jgi:hypothetical protein
LNAIYDKAARSWGGSILGRNSICRRSKYLPGIPNSLTELQPISLSLYPNGCSRIMSRMLRTADFDRWLAGLRDQKGKARITR